MKTKRGSRGATVLLNKFAVARRQINAVIRMYFSEVDALAVHTVAGAAVRIVKDLNGKRGLDTFQHAFKLGLLTLIQDYLSGKSIPADLRETVGTIVANMNQSEKEFYAALDGSDLTQFNLLRYSPKESWSQFAKAMNYLKHADIDSDQMLDENQIDNLDTILAAIGGYLQLGLGWSNEMRAFYLYLASYDPTMEEAMSDIGKTSVCDLRRRKSATRRRQECLRLLRRVAAVEKAKRVDNLLNVFARQPSLDTH